MSARVDSPVIIESAINGGKRKEQNPNTPITPAEIAADALACLESGAAIVHQHDALQPGDGPEAMAAASLAAYRPVLDQRPDAILYPTTNWGGPIERRWGHHQVLVDAGVLRAAFVDPGSVNLGGTGPDGLPLDTEFVYTNTPHDIHWKFAACERLQLGPSMAIFEPGFLRTALHFERAGRMPAGAFVKLYFGAGVNGGLSFGLPPTRASLDAYLALLDGSRLPWAVAVLGGDCLDSGMARMAMEAGGHVRVGLEDYVSANGRTPRNAELVEEVVSLAAEIGRAVATPAEAAAILGLPR